MNQKQMLEDINDLVSNDFCHDMSAKLVGYFAKEEPYTQEDASCMAQLIGKVYSIAHQIHCDACLERGEFNDSIEE